MQMLGQRGPSVSSRVIVASPVSHALNGDNTYRHQNGCNTYHLAHACRKPRGPASELATVRTLAVLSAVWQQLSLAKTTNTVDIEAQLSHYVTVLGPLVGSLTTLEARQALSAGFLALSGLLPQLATSARLLSSLSKWSESTIGEPDYETSLTAYGEMTVGLWMKMDKMQGLPLIQQCFWDLRNPNDLALRHAAAQVHLLSGLHLPCACATVLAARQQICGKHCMISCCHDVTPNWCDNRSVCFLQCILGLRVLVGNAQQYCRILHARHKTNLTAM